MKESSREQDKWELREYVEKICGVHGQSPLKDVNYSGCYWPLGGFTAKITKKL